MDPTTVIAMLAIHLIASGGLMYLVSRLMPDAPGLVLWAATSAMFGVGYLARLSVGLSTVEMATRDALTGVLNRNGLDKALRQHFAQRGAPAMSLLLVDRGRQRGSGCWRARLPPRPDATSRSRRAPQARGLAAGPGLGPCLPRGCDPSSRSPQISGEVTDRDGSPPRNRPARDLPRERREISTQRRKGAKAQKNKFIHFCIFAPSR
ncbi:hypothetical protein [Sorangium sp. So ce861]|uniref:hypothetical protein n=1 Tax=Sorangium sp. So ce861 TaxID=3133323 RepID=UPI003F5EFC6C